MYTGHQWIKSVPNRHNKVALKRLKFPLNLCLRISISNFWSFTSRLEMTPHMKIKLYFALWPHPRVNLTLTTETQFSNLTKNYLGITIAKASLDYVDFRILAWTDIRADRQTDHNKQLTPLNKYKCDLCSESGGSSMRRIDCLTFLRLTKDDSIQSISSWSI